MQRLKAEEQEEGQQLLRESMDMEEMERASQLQLQQQAEKQRQIKNKQALRQGHPCRRVTDGMLW